MYYHASQIPNIKILEPSVSNHEIPLIYFSSKRENTLVYLSNAVEKCCLETGFIYNGRWKTWASYGFTNEGILRLDEYYPNSTEETYKGASGYVYSVNTTDDFSKQSDIPYAYTLDKQAKVLGCEYIADAYEELLKAKEQGMIVLTRYENNSHKMLRWIENAVLKDYEEAENQPDYRHFLKEKFDFISDKY